MAHYDIINFSIKKQDGISWELNLKSDSNCSYVSIGKVIQGSLPFRVNLREDDILLAVNDKDARSYSAKEVNDMITKSGENLNLRVKRKKSFQEKSAVSSNLSSTENSFNRPGPNPATALHQNRFVLSDRTQKEKMQTTLQTENGTKRQKSPSPTKPFHFNLNDAVSSLTIPGTNVTLDENKTKEFLMMTFEEEVRKQNTNKHTL